MPNWKKVITSGSNAHLNQITASGEIFATGDIESDGTIIGDGLNINGTTTFNDGNITNVGDITLDSISDDATGGDTNVSLSGTEVSIDVGGASNQSMKQTSYKIEVPITASGNISSSGDVYADDLFINNISSLDNSGTTLRLGFNSTHTGVIIGRNSVTTETTIHGHLTASGDISSSKFIKGNSYQVQGMDVISTNGGTEINLAADSSATKVVLGKENSTTLQVFLPGQVTASGNISSSGTITGNSLAGTLTTAAQTNITSLGTLSTLTVDDITINGSTISDGGDFTLDVGGDITLDANGADIILSDDGTDFGRFKRDSSDFIIKSETNNKDIVFRGQDGGSTITALTLDMSEAGNAIFNNNISASGGFFVSSSGNVMINSDNTGSMETHKGAFSINYGDATQITGSLVNDGDGYGEIVKFGGTTGMTAGRCVYLKSDGSWGDADASGGNAAAAMSGSLLGIALGTNSDIDGVLLRGFVEAAVVVNNVVGQKVYVLAHANGRLGGDAPDSNGNIVRVAGYSLTNHDEIYFNPDNTWIEVTA